MKLAITLLITTLVINTPIQAAVDENTVAVWLFEEGGGETVKDATGKGHDARFEGKPKWTKGKFGGGLDFPVTIPDTSSLIRRRHLNLRN